MYSSEIEFLAENEDPDDDANGQRTQASDSYIDELVSLYPGIPTEYLMYLQQVGWGSFREDRFEIFDQPVFMSGEGIENLRYLAFGHNFSGDTSVFDVKKSYSIAEHWHESNEMYESKLGFKDYIRKRMFIGDDGSDLCANA